jgi:hypothetical protein
MGTFLRGERGQGNMGTVKGIGRGGGGIYPHVVAKSSADPQKVGKNPRFALIDGRKFIKTRRPKF